MVIFELLFESHSNGLSQQQQPSKPNDSIFSMNLRTHTFTFVKPAVINPASNQQLRQISLNNIYIFQKSKFYIILTSLQSTTEPLFHCYLLHTVEHIITTALGLYLDLTRF
jgi:hypothetical protein